MRNWQVRSLINYHRGIAVQGINRGEYVRKFQYLPTPILYISYLYTGKFGPGVFYVDTSTDKLQL